MRSLTMTLSMVTTFALMTGGCSDATRLPTTVVNQQDESIATITITKIKKPWYAPKFYVVNKMKATIPQYRKVTGLAEKNYSFADGTSYFGGVYHWESESAAKTWFNDAWFKNIEDKYGVNGQVEYYEVTGKTVYLKVAEENQALWAVLSDEAADLTVQDDLVEVIKTKDESGKSVTFSLWLDKSKAKQYLERQSNATLMLLPATIYNWEE